MATVVSVSETYDLSTKPNKMSLVAIHTPSSNLIKKTYPGLAVNHRFFRFLKCDVKLACASVLPADPLQVGVSAGDIAPQDMFNPILYKAITSEGLSVLESRLIGIGKGAYGNNDHPIAGESVYAQNSNTTGQSDDFATYYGLLSHRDGFKIAHPQKGLTMRGLIPLVYEKLYQYGQNEDFVSGGNDGVAGLTGNQAGTGLALTTGMSNRSIKGRPHKLPKINCTYLADFHSDNFGLNQTAIQDAWEHDMPDIPQCYVGLICLPPAKLNVLYYRLVVRWLISFEEPRPIVDILSFAGMGTVGNDLYKTDYVFSKSESDTVMDMVDTRDADIEKIMEGI